jgi:hypothetical protein
MQTNSQEFLEFKRFFRTYISSSSNNLRVEYIGTEGIEDWINDLSNIYQETEKDMKEKKMRRVIDLKNFKEAEVIQFEEIIEDGEIGSN